MTVREWFRIMRASDWAQDKEALMDARKLAGLEPTEGVSRHLKMGSLSGTVISVQTIEESVRWRQLREIT